MKERAPARVSRFAGTVRSADSGAGSESVRAIMKRTRGTNHLPRHRLHAGRRALPLEANAAEVTVARYSTVQPAPSLAQRDPGSTGGLGTAGFRDSDRRSGRTLLGPSGYRLASLACRRSRAGRTSGSALPEAHPARAAAAAHGIGDPRRTGVHPGRRSRPPSDLVRAV